MLLASYAKVKRRERAMDFLHGSGIADSARSEDKRRAFSRLEIQEYSAEMAQRSVQATNHLENDVEIFKGDVKTASQQFEKKCLMW